MDEEEGSQPLASAGWDPYSFGGSMSTASDFMVGLLDLVFFLFDKQDNVLLLIPFTVIFWCLCFAIIKYLMHLFLR